jgi:hypothetical protein
MPPAVCTSLATPIAVVCCQAATAVLLDASFSMTPHVLPWHSLTPWPQLQLLFIDTEGFESTGKADVYDDRIFALSALMSQVRRAGRAPCGRRHRRCRRASERAIECMERARCLPRCCCLMPALLPAACACGPQVLVYNLPESIRESDLEKLSFAVELSKAFYSTSPAEGALGGGGGNALGSGTAGVGGNGGNASLAAAAGGGGAGGSSGQAEPLPLQPGNMVWLIQRDFLQARRRRYSPANMLGHSPRLLLLLAAMPPKALRGWNPASTLPPPRPPSPAAAPAALCAGQVSGSDTEGCPAAGAQPPQR